MAVLALHHVPARTSLAPTAISARALRRILAAARDRGWRFVSADHAGGSAAAAGGPPVIALTADDGYQSHAAHLQPLARELAVPWTVFVLAGSLGRMNRWDLGGVGMRERHLNAEEVRRLAGEGVTIGSHGMSHRVMTGLPDLELAEELAASRDALRRISGQPVEAIAYPRGRVDARVAVAAAAAGYRLGFALSAPAGGVKGVSPRMLIRRTALYAPDQIPGLFEATSLAGFPPLRALRSGLGRAGGSLILAALRMRGRAHG